MLFPSICVASLTPGFLADETADNLTALFDAFREPFASGPQDWILHQLVEATFGGGLADHFNTRCLVACSTIDDFGTILATFSYCCS